MTHPPGTRANPCSHQLYSGCAICDREQPNPYEMINTRRAKEADGMKRIEPRESMTPGPRTTVLLNIAQQSLPTLIAGIHADRCWLVDEGDGVYGFHATQPMGESRKQPGTPAADLLAEMASALADMLDDPEVPQRLRDRRDELVDRYLEQTAPPSSDASSS